MTSPVTANVDGNVGIIELSRPERFNCLSLEAHQLIDTARARFEGDRNVRSILIRSTGTPMRSAMAAYLARVKRTAKGLRSS